MFSPVSGESFTHFRVGRLDEGPRAGFGRPTGSGLRSAGNSFSPASLREGSFKETARLLSVPEKDLGEEISDLTKIPLYAEFVKSRDYAAWVGSRKKD